MLVHAADPIDEIVSAPNRTQRERAMILAGVSMIEQALGAKVYGIATVYDQNVFDAWIGQLTATDATEFSEATRS